MSIARQVRDLNDHLWDPEAVVSAQPQELVEPSAACVIDRFRGAEGVRWCQVYIDGSCIDHNGLVLDRAPNAARDRRLSSAA